MKLERPTAILIKGPLKRRNLRPALFLFGTTDGFAWVEPLYLEPYPTGQFAFHRAHGAKTTSANSLSVRTEATVYSASRRHIPLDQTVAAALAWGVRQLEAADISYLDERERLRMLLAEELS